MQITFLHFRHAADFRIWDLQPYRLIYCSFHRSQQVTKQPQLVAWGQLQDPIYKTLCMFRIESTSKDSE